MNKERKKERKQKKETENMVYNKMAHTLASDTSVSIDARPKSVVFVSSLALNTTRWTNVTVSFPMSLLLSFLTSTVTRRTLNL